MYEGAETAIMVDLLVGSTIETSKKGLWRTFSFRVIYSHFWLQNGIFSTHFW